jgi:hypothetical protein
VLNFLLVFYPEKNTLLAVIPRLSTEWSISFELHPLYGVVVQPDKLCNIFHLTIGGAWGDFGDRIPAVFMKNNEISVASAINNNPNFSPSLGIRLIDKPLKMEINQLYVSGGRYRFFIMNDGQEVLSKLTNATQYYNVKVYGSNPISRCPNVVVRNFQHTNFP